MIGDGIMSAADARSWPVVSAHTHDVTESSRDQGHQCDRTDMPLESNRNALSRRVVLERVYGTGDALSVRSTG